MISFEQFQRQQQQQQVGGPRTAHLDRLPEEVHQGQAQGSIPINQQIANLLRPPRNVKALAQFVRQYWNIPRHIALPDGREVPLDISGTRWFPPPLASTAPAFVPDGPNKARLELPTLRAETSHGLARTVSISVDIKYEGPLCSIDPNTGQRTPLEIKLSDKRFVRIHGSLQPRKPYQDPVTGEVELGDLDNVSIYTLFVRKYHNKSGCKLQVAPNFQHRVLEEMGDKDFYETQRVRGLLVGQFLNMEENMPQEKEHMAYALHVQSVAGKNKHNRYHFLNPDFITTTGRISSRNGSLRNGIIEIPREVCVEAGLPLTDLYLQQHPEHREAVEKHPAHRHTKGHFLVPPNHIMSWGLNTTDDQRRSVNINSEQLRDGKTVPTDLQGAEGVMYNIVSDTNLRDLMLHYSTTYDGKVDNRRLGDVGLLFLPLRQGRGKHETHGAFSLRMSISYVVWPRMTPERLAGLSAEMPPQFPPLRTFVPNVFDSMSGQVQEHESVEK
jgi:hypothetical protein